MRLVLIASLSIALSFVALGCEGGSSSSAPTVSTGLSAETSLSELSDDEVVKLCEAARDVAIEAAEMSDPCIAIGVMMLAFGGDAASCEAAVDECQASPENTGFQADESTSAACDGTYRENLGSECTATVAEYEACLNAGLAAQHEVAQSLNCNMDLTADGAGDTQEEPEKPAECIALEEKGCTLDAE